MKEKDVCHIERQLSDVKDAAELFELVVDFLVERDCIETIHEASILGELILNLGQRIAMTNGATEAYTALQGAIDSIARNRMLEALARRKKTAAAEDEEATIH